MVRLMAIAGACALCLLVVSACRDDNPAAARVTIVDCEICAEYDEVKECATAESVSSSACEACSDTLIAAAEYGVTTADVVQARELGVAFTCSVK